MTAKEYLKQIRKLDVIVRQQKQEIARLERDAASLKSVDYSADKVRSGTHGASNVELAVEKIIAARDEYTESVTKLTQMRESIIAQMQGLDEPVHIDVLYRRFVEYKSFETIAAETCYTQRNVYHLYAAALEEFEKKFSETFK